MANLFESWRKFLKEEKQPVMKPEQIEDFISYLQDQGNRVFKTRIKVSDLKPFSEERDMKKIKNLISLGQDRLSSGTPIFVSRDAEIVEDACRWYALKAIDPNADMPVWQADMDAGSLAHEMKKFINK